MTLAAQTTASSLPCPKTGCAGKMEVAQTWPAKLEKFRNVQLECPLCHLRDFQNFPVPERVFEAAIPFDFAAVVEHQIHGRGMVVKSGPNFTRVCFQGQKGKETEVFTLDLKLTQDAEELNAYRQTQERINRKTGKTGKIGQSRTTVSVVCPRCDEKAGALFAVKGEQICALCAAEVGAGADITRRPDGKPRSFSIDPLMPPGYRAFIPGGNPDDLPGNRDMHCELCGQSDTKLVFAERLWICRMCKDFCDIGDKVV